MSSGRERVPKDFKSGGSMQSSQEKRQQNIFQLAKSKREESMNIRRRKMVGPDDGNSMGGDMQQQQGDGSNEKQISLQEQLAALPQLVQGVRGSDVNVQLDCTVRFRKLLSIEHNPPIQDVIDTGIIPRLVQFLTFQESPRLQFEAAWALTNIASGSSKHTLAVIDAGAVPVLVTLLRSPSDDVKEQAVWALGNIAGDSHRYRDLVLEAGALQPLIELCQSNIKVSMLRNATWTLSNLCRGKPQPNFNMVAPALPTLAGLINSTDDEVLTDACWALSYLTDDDTEPENIKIEAVLKAGIAGRLVDLLKHASNVVRTPALRTVGNIVTGNDLQTEVILNCGVLQSLAGLLTNAKKGIRKESCWAISNITAGNTSQIQQVLQAGLFQHLVDVISKQEFEVAKEAVWAICNATNGGDANQIRYISQQSLGAVQALSSLLQGEDVKIVQVAMEGLENMLKIGLQDAGVGGDNVVAMIIEDCGGLDHLELLQQSDNAIVYNKSQFLIKTYFGVEESDMQVAPEVSTDGSTFQFGSNMEGNTNYRF